jgi:hypothetical protein
MFKLCTIKTHSYKHNEQINKQSIDNSECVAKSIGACKKKQKKLYNQPKPYFFKNLL